MISRRGYSATDTKAAFDEARALIERAEALGEPVDDSLFLFSVLYGFWIANYATSNGDLIRNVAAQFLALAERQAATVPLMVGHRLMGQSLLYTGDVVEGRAHFDRAIALYAPAEHRSLATRFGQDVGVATLSFRSLALWLLGYPEAALEDTRRALSDAREIGQAATLMYALFSTSLTSVQCGNYAAADAQSNEVVALAAEKRAALWQARGMMNQGCVSALTGHAVAAIRSLAPGIAAYRSTGATVWLPICLSYLARAYAEAGQFDDAWRSIGEATNAVEATKERWCEAEIHRTAGEIALASPQRDVVQAEAYFERALRLAQEQQAKAWELRAATSLARLHRNRGKPQQAYDLLAPVFAWFTEGFDTLDLKEAKALLDDLAS